MRRFAYRAVLWCGGAVTVALAAAAALTVIGLVAAGDQSHDHGEGEDKS